jgi:deoxyribonuclease V
VVLNIPSVGCAKTRLVGEHGEVGDEKGSRTPLTRDGDLLGYVVRTKDGVKPLFVSPGNLISREGAVDLVLSAVGKYRLPEPIRAAHNLANRVRREFKEGGK